MSSIESELGALWADGHSRTRATELVIERAVADAARSDVVVLVEGVSDLIVLDVLAARRGLDLRDAGIAIVPMGGATNIGRFVDLFGPRGLDLRLAGLCDASEEQHIARSLMRAGLGSRLDREGLAAAGFYVCVEDIEDELIRNLGTAKVERIIEKQGDLTSFRTMRREPFHRERRLEQQVHRFVRGRNYRYARALTEALDLSCVPRPLEQLLTHVGA